MTEPFALEAILSEFSPGYEAWILRDAKSGKYVTIPHPTYPGRTTIHFFMSRQDAVDILAKIVASGNQKIAAAPIIPVKVNLHQALKSIASDKTPGHADSFAMHSPNEVFEFLWSGK